MTLSNAVNANTQGFQSLNTTTGVWNGRTLQAGTNITITNPDGTGGDPTISAASSSSSAFGTLTLVDDFLQFGNSAGDTVWSSPAGGISLSGIANHPGIFNMGTSGSGTLTKVTTVGGLPILLGSGIVTIEMVVRVPATGTANIWLGLSDINAATTNTEPVNGCYFNYASGTNSGKWVGKTSSASSRSSANSNNTVTAGNWDRLKIVVNSAGTSVSFFVNGSEITNSPLATNIPSVAIGPSVTVAAAATNTVHVDLIVLTYVLSVSR